MKWHWATVHGWFAAADVTKRSKKVSLCNIVFPPLSVIMIKFVALRAIIIDPLADVVWVGCLTPGVPVSLAATLWSSAGRRGGGGVG